MYTQPKHAFRGISRKLPIKLQSEQGGNLLVWAPKILCIDDIKCGVSTTTFEYVKSIKLSTPTEGVLRQGELKQVIVNAMAI